MKKKYYTYLKKCFEAVLYDAENNDDRHVNDAFRNRLNIKKVTSSHKKGESVIISEGQITSEQLEKALDGSGYRILGSESVPYEKKELFSR